jgi:signal peptidase I
MVPDRRSKSIANAEKQGSSRAAQRGLLVLILLLGGAVYFYLTTRAVVVQGPSMLPTLKAGDEVLVSRAYWLFGGLRKDDVVVLKQGSEGYLIKRIYALAGQTVDWQHVPRGYSVSSPAFVVPEGTVYVVGDNEAESQDSRHFGPVEVNAVIGKVVRKL